MKIVLFGTDQAQNFGTIARTAVTLGVEVHVIEPLGFVWDDKRMRRAGMDYLDRLNYKRHKSWAKFLEAEEGEMKRLVAITVQGAEYLQNFQPQEGDYYIFGRESAGLPEEVHSRADARIRIPMAEGERSMNLAVSAGIIMFDSLSKLGKLPQ